MLNDRKYMRRNPEEDARGGVHAMFGLIIANVVVYIIQHMMAGADLAEAFALSVPAAKQFEIWRFFTACFLHGGFMHMFFNMFGLYIFGSLAAPLLGAKRFLLLYREGGKVINNVYIGSAGGHFEANELNKPEICVLREMKEEIGVTSDMIENLALRYVVLRNVDGEIRQNYYFFADLKDEYTDELQSNEGTLRWVDFDEVRFVLTEGIKIVQDNIVSHFWMFL